MGFTRKLWDVYVLAGTNRHLQNEWQESVQVNYSYSCLNHCFQSFGLCPGIWRIEEWDVFWEQYLFLQQSFMLWDMLRAVACPEWSCLPAALTAAWPLAWTQSVPLQQGKLFWKLRTTRIACWRSWGSSSNGPSPVLGLACCHSVPGPLLKYTLHPRYEDTDVEQCISHGIIGICFIKVPMNGQKPCLGRCAQHFKWEAKCRGLLL